MYFPSGDQSGCQLFPGRVVIRTGSPPVTCLTHISDFPPRLKLYAMKRPSGDQVAPVCSPSSKVSRVRARCWMGTLLFTSEQSKFMREAARTRMDLQGRNFDEQSSVAPDQQIGSDSRPAK